MKNEEKKFNNDLILYDISTIVLIIIIGFIAFAIILPIANTMECSGEFCWSGIDALVIASFLTGGIVLIYQIFMTMFLVRKYIYKENRKSAYLYMFGIFFLYVSIFVLTAFIKLIPGTFAMLYLLSSTLVISSFKKEQDINKTLSEKEKLYSLKKKTKKLTMILLLILFFWLVLCIYGIFIRN